MRGAGGAFAGAALSLTLTLSLTAAATQAPACTLHLTEHRSGQALFSLPLDPTRPEITIAFEHSVLGTTVHDRYRFMPQPTLVEERFEGEGYGLPIAAGPGEQLLRDGEGWRLLLQRPVDPLVVRPLPSQRMRLTVHGQQWLLAQFSTQAIAFQVAGCAPAFHTSP